MTIKEVARLAGVSPAAVSRYLNGGPLSKDKKERVARAIEETGYRPNLMAKTMRTGRVRQIGIIVPRIYSESVNLMMEGITEELLSMDYLTVLGYSDANRDRELQYLDIMQSNRVAGIILMATSLTDIKKSSLENCSVPLVITGQNFDGINCVYHDDFNAMRELTELFIRKGGKAHRKRCAGPDSTLMACRCALPILTRRAVTGPCRTCWRSTRTSTASSARRTSSPTAP